MPDRLFSSNNKSSEDVKPVKYFFPYTVSSYKESPHDYTISSKIGKVAKNIPIALFLFLSTDKIFTLLNIPLQKVYRSKEKQLILKIFFIVLFLFSSKINPVYIFLNEIMYELRLKL